jgi:ABC-2 type transport system ATP-binding protein
MLLGMTHPTRGEARVLGAPISRTGGGPWSKVGYLVDTGRAYPDLTVMENLELARRLQGVGDRMAVDRALDTMGLGDLRDRPAGVLSLGNLQRLGLARALLHQPELLILDEPANGLDPAGIADLRELLQRLAASGVAIFVSSHILAEIAKLAGRIGIIDGGRLLTELDAGDLERRYRRRLVVDALDRGAARRVLEDAGRAVSDAGDAGLQLVDADSLAHPERVASLLVSADAPPTCLHVVQEDLEAFFLRLLADKRVAA